MIQIKKDILTEELTYEDMKSGISKAGGLFYQYRPCRRNANTIYDIENIRHGVVYAQTPLNMNDPFDSMVGFSVEKIYDDFIGILIEALHIEDDNIKLIVHYLLKYKALGKFTDLILVLKKIKSYLQMKQKEMHMGNIPFNIFIHKNASTLYSKSPKDIKTLLHQKAFFAFSLIISKIGDIEISNKSINDILSLNTSLDKLSELIIETQNKTYIPVFKKFLSSLTVSCFSVCGWDNQLMWSHYANSYSGICIEYDFTKIDDIIGFIYPVNYTNERPTVSLYDLGINGINTDQENKIENGRPNLTAFISYLLAKNTCWDYEKEWRIINFGAPNTPKSIDLPFIKSITLGVNMEDSYKQFIFDICKEKNIECYELVLSKESFSLSRALIDESSFLFNFDKERNYIDLLTQQAIKLSEEIDKNSNEFVRKCENGNTDCSYLLKILEGIIDTLCNAYFIKLSVNRFCNNISQSEISNENLEDILKIKNFVTDCKEPVEALKSALDIFKNNGNINDSEYRKAEKHINDARELIQKIESYSWHPFITPNSLINNCSGDEESIESEPTSLDNRE